MTRPYPLLLAIILTPSIGSAQNIAWAHGTGGPLTDLAYGVAVAPSGMVITTGTFTGTIDLDPGTGVFNVSAGNDMGIFIQAVSAAGAFLWGGAIGTSNSNEGRGVACDGSGNVYVTGFFSTTTDMDIGPGTDLRTPVGGSDAFVMKLDPSGAAQWIRTFGGAGNDRGLAIAVSAAGNVVTTGSYSNTADLDPGPGTQNSIAAGNTDIYIQALDPNGDFIWATGIGGTGADKPFGMDLDADGSVVVTGTFTGTVDFDPGTGSSPQTAAGNVDIFVLKLDPSGDFQWVDRIGSSSLEEANAIAVDGLGNVIITGRITLTLDVDPGPGVTTITSTGVENTFLVKLDPNGGFIWGWGLGPVFNSGLAIDTDPAGNILLTGSFTTTMDADPGPGVTTLTSNGGSDVFVARYSPDGIFDLAFGVGGTSGDAGRSIRLGSDGSVHVAGDYRQSPDMDPGPGTLVLAGSTFQNAFTAKYELATCGNIAVSVKALLEGPLVLGTPTLMRDSLRTLGLVPLSEPYSLSGFTLSGPGTTTSGVLAVSGTNAVVDWVVLELRDPNDPTIIIESRAALLQRDGDVVAPGGTSPVLFCAPAGEYHVALRHRNHLGVMTASHLFLSSTTTLIDLTTSDPVFGSPLARHDLGGLKVLWPGNALPDAVVKYTGSANDRDAVLVRIGSTMPNTTVPGYWPEDLNLDGNVKYTGSANDRDIILTTIGGTSPNAIKVQQLP